MGAGSRISCVSLASIALGLATPAASAGAAMSGSDVFIGECSGCHSVAPGRNKMGPSLFAVVGRRAATIAGFPYSDGMKNSGIVWQPETLHAYLSDPAAAVPGCRMPYPGLKDLSMRSALIDYLSTLH